LGYGSSGAHLGYGSSWAIVLLLFAAEKESMVVLHSGGAADSLGGWNILAFGLVVLGFFCHCGWSRSWDVLAVWAISERSESAVWPEIKYSHRV
jgi:hypothetical protein